MRRKDGLTSAERKDKYTEKELKKLANEANTYYRKNGWRSLKLSELKLVKNGQKIRCCAWECGCFGQIEDLKVNKKPDRCGDFNLSHTNHREPFGYYRGDKSLSDMDNWYGGAFEKILVRSNWNPK